VLRIGREECPYCHRSSEIYISDPKSIWEKLVVLLLLRPVKCHDCMCRFLRPCSSKLRLRLGQWRVENQHSPLRKTRRGQRRRKQRFPHLPVVERGKPS
jgi:hypothetical protein